MRCVVSVVDSADGRTVVSKAEDFSSLEQGEALSRFTWSEEELQGKVDLWWPVGYGSQKLYDVSVELKTRVRLFTVSPRPQTRVLIPYMRRRMGNCWTGILSV
jgi:hypothetical protein